MVVLYDEERQTKCDTDHGRDYVEACWTQAQLLLLGLLAWAVRNFGCARPDFVQIAHGSGAEFESKRGGDS